jgi:hypothetical protein
LAGKVCSTCGDELVDVEAAGGTIYECAEHGVKDWIFEPKREASDAPKSLRDRLPLRDVPEW